MLVRVKPAEGCRIRQPNRNGMVMSEKGDIVSLDDTYYARLIMTGDLEVVEEDVQPKQAAEAPAEKKK